MLRDGLGKTPDGDYLDYFVPTKRDEVRSSHGEVTPLGARPLPPGLLTATDRTIPTRTSHRPTDQPDPTEETST